MLVPEALGGLGLQTTDFILLAEACGEVALPEPVVESVMVSTPLLVDILDQGWVTPMCSAYRWCAWGRNEGGRRALDKPLY